MIIFLWILIQIIGESLPISSSGHVQLMQNVLGISVPSDSWMIDFLLHGPTIVILLICFFSTWWKMIFGGKGEDVGPFQFSSFFSALILPTLFIFIADLITFIFWALKIKEISFIQAYFLPIGFCMTAACLYFSRYAKNDKVVVWLWSDAILLGLVQAVSLLPGISRFASTYAAGLWLGYGRNSAFGLSFLIQMPLLCAAFFKGMNALVMHHEHLLGFMQNWVLFTIVVASLISYKLFCWVAMLIEQNRLWYFAWYMIIPIFMSFLW